MNALTTAPQAESKDIKLSSKKVADSKSEESSDFFENIISSIVNESDESENKSFLLSKLLNLSSDFEKKEEVLSSLSDEPLFNSNQIGQVSIQDLLKVATMIKGGEEPANFPTDSKTLKLALLKPDVKEQFKNAKSIKDVLDIAKKNNIEVKNFQFLKEEAALNPTDKKIVKQLKSEDIFKLIEKQTTPKAKLSPELLNNPKTKAIQNSDKTNILQSVLASKELVKPLVKETQKPSVKETSSKVKVQSNIPSVETTKPESKQELKVQSNTTSVETTKSVSKQEVKIQSNIQNIETNKSELKQEIKIQSNTQNIETNKEKMKIDKNNSIQKDTEVKKEKIDEPKIEKNIEPNSVNENKKETKIKNFQQNINIQKSSNSKEINNLISKEIKTEEASEKVDKEKDIQPIEKTEQTTETKTHNVDKTKHTTDVKKTFSTFAQEFKEKVENYKPPLMKIKMELNPKGLGEVDVTLINRGNNLQVNINSNSSTIAMFMQNQTEFKNSLVNMGFADLQMNFGEGQKKEQDSHNQKNGKNVFEHFEDEEEQDGFEMIIPRYV